MRSERIRATVLARLGIRDETSFTPMTNSGPLAVEAALAHLLTHGPAGDYHEYGVYRGYTFWHAQQVAVQRGLSSMRFFGFDSFEGLPEIVGDDRKAGIFVSGDYRCARADVERNLTEHGFDWSHAVLVEGYFDRSLTGGIKQSHAMGPVALAMIDCDLYQSTVPVLSFLADLLQDGTVIVFDDWYCFGESGDGGEPKAFREFLAEHPEWHAEPFMRIPRYAQAFIMRRRPQEPNAE